MSPNTSIWAVYPLLLLKTTSYMLCKATTKIKKNWLLKWLVKKVIKQMEVVVSVIEIVELLKLLAVLESAIKVVVE